MVKPTVHKAVALQYDEGQDAPKVIAKGTGIIAEKIIETAKNNNVPLVKNDLLVDEMIGLDLGQDIPPALYQAVAEVYTFLINMDDKIMKGQKNES